MATFKRVGTIGTFQRKMIDGMLANGYDRAFAERCFQQIEGFGEYGFPESHAASFALLVYASAWLKCHYPDAFAAALLNAQPMGFYAPAQIVRDAREHGVEVRAPDVNHSDWDSTLEPGPRAAERLHELHRDMRADVRATHAIRLGLREIKGLREEDGRLIVERRTLHPPPRSFSYLPACGGGRPLARTRVMRGGESGRGASLSNTAEQAYPLTQPSPSQGEGASLRQVGRGKRPYDSVRDRLAAHRPLAARAGAAGRCRCFRLARPFPARGAVGGQGARPRRRPRRRSAVVCDFAACLFFTSP